MLQGHTISTELPEDIGLGERFWYWRGNSGQSYIHSIYASDACPPVPGAIYVLVRKVNGMREAVDVGRFDGRQTIFRMDRRNADYEVHVHLLARSEDAAEKVLHDLRSAFFEDQRLTVLAAGFSEPRQLELLAA